MKKILNNKGYTLVELLAVIVIMITVGTVIMSILVSALRGGNKSQTTNQVRESGNYVISQMSKMITFAKHLDGLSTDNIKYDSNCVLKVVSPAPTPIPYQYIKFTAFDGGQTTFSCSGGNIASNTAALIDTSTLVVTNCTFICTQPSISIPPTIDISFTLNEKINSSFSEKKASIPFETSITIRNAGN
jgi:type II secretory pathway pseudopilin PulG